MHRFLLEGPHAGTAIKLLPAWLHLRSVDAEMIDGYGAVAIIAAAATIIGGVVAIFKRRRIQKAHDEMRKVYGRDWL